MISDTIYLISMLAIVGLIIFIYEKILLPIRVRKLSNAKMKSTLENISIRRRGIYKHTINYNKSGERIDVEITCEVEEVDKNLSNSTSKIKLINLWALPVTEESDMRNHNQVKSLIERWHPTKNIKWMNESSNDVLKRKLEKALSS